MISFIKKFFCKHDSNIIYDGIGGGFGFSFRRMHCEKCNKKFESLTFAKTFDDKYTKGEKINKEDIEFFNSEVK